MGIPAHSNAVEGISMTIYTKVCSRCKLDKPASDFCKDKRVKDGLTRQCKACYKDYRESNIDRIKERDKIYYRANEERYKERYESNKEELVSYQKDYDQANKERIKSFQKEYYEANKELLLDYKKKYYQSNKQRINEQVRVRRSEDPLLSLIHRIRCLIGHSLRKNRYTKKSRTYEILGCSYEEFMVHIESQFAEGMSWENRDKWHIDHRVPVSWGITEEEVIALNHYSNLKPMWAIENTSKKNRFAD